MIASGSEKLAELLLRFFFPEEQELKYLAEKNCESSLAAEVKSLKNELKSVNDQLEMYISKYKDAERRLIEMSDMHHQIVRQLLEDLNTLRNRTGE